MSNGTLQIRVQLNRIQTYQIHFSIFSNEKIGKGDCFIIMVSGLYLGFIDVLVLIWISSLLALIYGLITIKRLKKDSNYEIPFVPFLLSGFLLMYAIHSFGSLIL